MNNFKESLKIDDKIRDKLQEVLVNFETKNKDEQNRKHEIQIEVDRIFTAEGVNK